MQDTRTTIPFHGRSGMDLAASLLEGFLQVAGAGGSPLDEAHVIAPIVGSAGSLGEMLDALVGDITATCNEHGGLPIGGEIAHAVAGAGEFRAWGHLFFRPDTGNARFVLESGGVTVTEDHGTYDGAFWVDVANDPHS